MKNTGSRLLLGAHFSIAKGLHNAILEAEKYQCNTLQLFTKNANTWKEKTLTDEQIEKFEKTRKQTGIDQIISHTSYLINIANPDKKKTAKSSEALMQELVRCDQLGIPYVVLHPGSHMDSGEDAGIRRIAENLNRIFENAGDITPRLLLETTAGQGTGIGHQFEQLAAIMARVDNISRIGVCLDTCHIFAAGYDISDKTAYEKTFSDFDQIIGLDKLYAIHLNDAKKACGSRVDRHEHIGDGKIGRQGFKMLINDARLADIPKILETPKQKNGKDADEINLQLLRELKSSSKS